MPRTESIENFHHFPARDDILPLQLERSGFFGTDNCLVSFPCDFSEVRNKGACLIHDFNLIF
ncbi:MAG: hypothetical protein ACK56F_19480, partial [bacterium]